jgi:hypothetical protein
LPGIAYPAAAPHKHAAGLKDSAGFCPVQ